MGDQLKPYVGSATPRGAANTMRPKYANGMPSDPSVPPSNAYRPCDGAIVDLPFTDIRVAGSAPAADPRDPKSPQ